MSAGLDRVGVMHCDDVLNALSRFDAIHSWYGAARPDFQQAVRSLPFQFYDALPTHSGQHATAFYCSQVGADARASRIAVPASARGNFFIIHPFASNRAKQWPLARFRELAKELRNVRWCAGPEDLDRNPESIENPVVIENLLELGKWISTARAYIGNDSGITHLAAAVGTPTIALFGPTDPNVWGPPGAHVRVVARQAMDQIIPREVAAAVYDLL